QDRSRRLLMSHDRLDVEAVGPVDGAIAFGERDDHAAGLLAEQCRVIADVAEALHDDALALQPAIEAEPLHVVDVTARLAQAVVHAAPGGLHAPPNTALGDGLSRDARELVDSPRVEGAVGVGNPRHLARPRAV